MSESPRPSRPVLDNIFGAWFAPWYTLSALKQSPILWQAALVVAVVNVVDTGRKSGFTWDTLDSIVTGTFVGLTVWVLLASLLALLGYCLGRNTSLPVLLTLTGFAGLPWLLLAPAQALGGPFGVLLGIGAIGWFWVSELLALAIAFEQPWWRVIWLVPLTFAAAFLASGWLIGGLVALISLA